MSAGSPESAGGQGQRPTDAEASDADLARLRRLLAEVHDLRMAAAVLGWDQETYMPPGGGTARAEQLSTLGRLAHERFVADEVGELIERLEDDEEQDHDSTRASLLRVARRDHDRATKLPGDLVAELARAAALGQQAWRAAREDSDFAAFRPHLETLLDLVRQKAEALGYEESIYDPLLDEYEPGMPAATVARVFDEVREELVPIVEAIAGQPPPDDSCLRGGFDAEAQWEFGLSVIRDFGFDFDRGRQDRSAHPFSTAFSIGDVRITTRVSEEYLPTCLFGTLHECGHALYEQGIDPELERTPLADGTSLGMHESQSRLWENLVGRSRAFWSHYWSRLQEAFPGRLGEVELEAFYRAINRVEPSLIRVEADEVTYNLHVMLRFELEIALLQGDLAVADLPGAWNDGMERYLGIRPDSDADGCLQDIHWSFGAFGYFPTYALGNLISTQLFEKARGDLPDLSGQIAAGEFGELLGWLRRHIHRHGRKYTAAELLDRVTGGGLSATSWLDYVRGKFGELYPGI